MSGCLVHEGILRDTCFPRACFSDRSLRVRSMWRAVRTVVATKVILPLLSTHLQCQMRAITLPKTDTDKTTCGYRGIDTAVTFVTFVTAE